MNIHMTTENTAQEDLRVLYPIFKTEVYQRREAMLRITQIGGITHLLFLVAIILLPHPPLLFLQKAVLLAGAGLFTGILLFQLRIHHQRHAEAKNQLIVLEHSLGLFESDETEKPVYPASWKHPPPNRILSIFSGALFILTILSWIAVLIS